MDLEKAYHRGDGNAICKLLEYGKPPIKEKKIKGFYENSKSCVRVGRVESDLFSVYLDLRHRVYASIDV